ncbi:MAG: NAD(P)H-binding protein [FCB group bacterium]|nr:NAD(P)H-binding protein [FCB group bacterium]
MKIRVIRGNNVKTIALFGGTGYLGGYLIKELIRNGYFVHLAVRQGSPDLYNDSAQVSVRPVTKFYDESILSVIQGCDAVIYNIGIIREFPPRGITFDELHFKLPVRIIRQAESLGIQRFLLMSANGVEDNLTAYERTKLNTERFLMSTSLDWTIFRPSVIFGDPGTDKDFVTQLYTDMIRPFIPAPLFFDSSPFKAGQFRMSPVYAGDVAKVMIQSLEMESAVGAIFPLGGPESLTWREIIRRISQAACRKKYVFPVPASLLKFAAGLFDRYAWFPITKDQITMLLKGNSCDSLYVFHQMNISPTPFSAEELSYILRK